MDRIVQGVLARALKNDNLTTVAIIVPPARAGNLPVEDTSAEDVSEKGHL